MKTFKLDHLNLAEDFLDVTSLSYLHFNTSNPGQFLNHCNSAYVLWKHQWVQTFCDLGVDKKLSSDDFLNRQLCGLFRGHQAIGFILYQHVNLKLNATLDSPYFNNYSDDLKTHQNTCNDQVFIISYMTIDGCWRKTNTNYSISELLISFVVVEFNFSEANRIIGYFRNNRSTNQIFYRHAGTFLSQKSAYNVEVDFAEIHKEKAHLSTKKDHAIVSLKLWEKFNNQKTKETTYGTEIRPQPRKNEQISPKPKKPRLEQQRYL